MYKMMCLFELVVPIQKEDSSFSVYSKIVETLKRRSVSLLYVNLSAIKSKVFFKATIFQALSLGNALNIS